MRLLSRLGLSFKPLPGLRPLAYPPFRVLDLRGSTQTLAEFGTTGTALAQYPRQVEIHVFIVKMEFDGTTLHNSLFIDRLFHNYLLDTLLLS
jgi:hypothetical protein